MESVWVRGVGPRHRYIGRGVIASLYADHDAQRQEQRQATRHRRRQERIQDAADLAALDDQYRTIRTTLHATLLASGWRAHRRQWRRRRWQVENMTMADLPAKQTHELTRTDIADLLQRCNVAKPKPSDLAALELFLRNSTQATMSALGTPAQVDAIIDGTDNTPGVKLVMKAEVRRLADELGYYTCPPMERALVGHIVVCWLRVQILEHRLTGLTSQTHERREVEHIDRRLIAAQARYIRAMSLLTKMRALAIANLQVNVAHGPQQVNNG